MLASRRGASSAETPERPAHLGRGYVAGGKGVREPVTIHVDAKARVMSDHGQFGQLVESVDAAGFGGTAGSASGPCGPAGICPGVCFRFRVVPARPVAGAGGWPSEEIALPGRRAETGDSCQFIRCLDPLGDEGRSKLFGEAGHRLTEGVMKGICRDSGDQVAVKFDDVGLELSDVAERVEVRAHAINGEADSALAQGSQGLDQGSGLLRVQGSGALQNGVGEGERGAPKESRQERAQASSRGQLERHEQVCWQVPGRGQGALQRGEFKLTFQPRIGRCGEPTAASVLSLTNRVRASAWNAEPHFDRAMERERFTRDADPLKLTDFTGVRIVQFLTSRTVLLEVTPRPIFESIQLDVILC